MSASDQTFHGSGAVLHTRRVTLFFGLVITFPLIGHATCNAFRDLVENGEGAVSQT